jgi:hypothetical protein
MNLYIIEPDSATHTTWINNQPRPDDPNNPRGPIAPVLIADGVAATWTAPLAKADGIPRSLDFVLSLSRDVGVGILAHLIVDWMLSNFKGRAEKVIIERTEVSFDRGELTKIVIETIERERG